jgi:hypothetical protein
MNSLTGGTSITTVSSTTGITAGLWKGTAIGAVYGGTGQTTYATGDILYASGANTLSKLTKPSASSYLKMDSAGTPTWDTLGLDDITATGTVTVGTWNASVISPVYGGTGIANLAANTISFSGNYSLGLTLSANTSVTLPTTGTLATLAGSEALTNKTVNKVTITAPATAATLTIANNKTLTASNTLTFTGTDASSIDFGVGGTVVYTTVGTLSSLVSVGTITTGTWSATAIAATKGGTGLTTYATGDLIYASATNTLSKLTAGSEGQIMAVTSGAPSWITAPYASTGKAIAMAMVFGG